MKSNIKKISLIFFGLSLTIVILEILLRLGGFIILSIQEYKNLQSIKEKGAYRIMCLGESTTQGQYPPYLDEILNHRNAGIKFSVIDKGKVGTNTTAILSQLEANIAAYNPDMVVTMMDCNDDAGVMYYKDIPEANTGVFQHCRLYRFGRIIYMHIANKLKENGFFNLNLKQADTKTDIKQICKPIESSINNEKKYPTTESSFAKPVELNPKNDKAYLELGQLYLYQGKVSLAEKMYKKAIKINPRNDAAYLMLGWHYQIEGNFSKAEGLIKKAIELNPKNDKANFDLGELYLYECKFSLAEKMYEKAIEINPRNYGACLELGWCYQMQNKFSQAEAMFKKALETTSKRDIAYGALGTLYKEIGKPELSKEYHAKANELRTSYINPNTLNNYLKLKQILDKRNIRLVCVQYPVRSIRPLKKIFAGQNGVIFVDNEQVFKEALKQNRYKEYFVDMFAGDFGHCTQKGNRLLAENIADTILKEVFHK